MATKTITGVPFRGKVKAVRGDGKPIADGTIQPVEILEIAAAEGVTPLSGGELAGYHSNWDYEAGTVDITLECDDQAYLDAVEAALASVPNLRSAEIAVMQTNEAALPAEERADAASRRVEAVKGLQIESADLGKWKEARGR
jgi:hypothetical protein